MDCQPQILVHICNRKNCTSILTRLGVLFLTTLLSECVCKLLGVYIDDKLSFEEHINLILKEGKKKLYALMRVSKYITQEKLRLLIAAFIESLFNYCPLVWMCHNRTLNKKINKLHERALRLVYKDKNLSFQQLLDKDKSFSVHERNLQKLALEMYKVKHGLCPKPFRDLFTMKAMGKNDFIIPKVNNVNSGTETIRYRGPKVWEIVPESIRSAESLSIFKNKIKKWKPIGCTCRLCKSYIQGVGYGVMKADSFC